MVKLEYSQIVRRKLKDLKSDLCGKYGEKRSKEIITAITKGVRNLEAFPLGASVSSIYDVKCDYYYIFVEHNYFFYLIEGEKIIVLEMFNEKEDFMRQLFGIITTSQQ